MVIKNVLDEERRHIQIAKRQGFDALPEINSRKGVVIEIAGPTDEGYSFVDFDEHTSPYFIDIFPKVRARVSNLYSGSPSWEVMSGNFLGFSGEVDFLADARKMPLKDGSVEIVFSSCVGEVATEGVLGMIEAGFGYSVPKTEKSRIVEREVDNITLREKTLKEIWRILRDGGMLVWQGVFNKDVELAQKLGFTIVQYEREDSQYRKLIFIKEKNR